MNEMFPRAPWTVEIRTVAPYTRTRDILIRDAHGGVVMDVSGNSREQRLIPRIVAAVNALAGVSEEAIETGVLRDALKESGLVPMEE